MFKDTERFRQAADNIYALTPDVCKIDMKPHVVRKAYLWYGQPPTTYLEAIGRLYVMPNITALEGKAVKIQRARDVYLVKGGQSHAISSVARFMQVRRNRILFLIYYWDCTINLASPAWLRRLQPSYRAAGERVQLHTKRK